MKPKILLVDDDAASRDLMADWLEHGFTVFEAKDALEGTDLLMHHHFDLLILDDCMPMLSGMDFLALLNLGGHYPKLPILVISAFLDGQVSKITRPHQAFLAKPFTYHELLDAITRVLAASRVQGGSGQANRSGSTNNGPHPEIGG